MDFWTSLIESLVRVITEVAVSGTETALALAIIGVIAYAGYEVMCQP